MKMEKEKKTSAADLWKDFSQSTGFHAINKLSGGSKIRGFIWLCLFTACASYMIVTVFQELKTYYSYPSLTSVEIETHKKMEFPSVTLCNLNPLSKDAMKNDSRIDNYYLSFAPTALQDFIRPIDWGDPFYAQEGFFQPRNITDVLSENKPLHNGLINIGSFDQVPVDSKTYLETVLTPEGPCLTSDPNKIFMTSHVGPEFNLMIWLHIDRDNSFFSQWIGEGVKVIVHDKNDDPFFHGPSAFFVEPGHEYYALVKKKTYTYLARPFKSMADSYCKETSPGGRPYKFTKCWKECYVNVLYSNCSCLDIQYKDYPICSKYTHLTCVKALKSKLDIELETICDCPMACSSTKYDVSLSSSLFPSKFYSDFLSKFDPSAGFDFFRNNFIVLHIFYDELKTTKVTQTPKYSSPAEIFGNIGGQFGLFLGASILTMTELLEFVIFLIRYCVKKSRDKDKVTKLKT